MKWFGGVLFFVNKTGKPMEEVAGAKRIPEDAQGLSAAFPNYKERFFEPQSPPQSKGELVTPKTDLESTGELVTPRTAIKGCRVRIWRKSKFADQSDSEGTILGLQSGYQDWVRVRFDDGFENCYQFGHSNTGGVSDLIHVS